MTNEVTTPSGKVSQDSRNIALLNWIGTLFFGFIPSLILFFMMKNDDYVTEQSKEALNWSITTIIAYVISGVLTVVLVGFVMIFIVYVMNVIFCIMGAVSTSNGQDFRVPYTLRIIQ